MAEQAAPRRSIGARFGTSLAALFLVLLMAIGSIFMWLVIPVGLVYGASQLVDTAAPTMGVYAGLFFAIPAAMFAMVRVLRLLEAAHFRVVGREQERYRPGWTKSMRAERGSGRSRTVLDTVMIWSVSVAMLAFGIWFFGFAGSSLPS